MINQRGLDGPLSSIKKGPWGAPLKRVQKGPRGGPL